MARRGVRQEPRRSSRVRLEESIELVRDLVNPTSRGMNPVACHVRFGPGETIGSGRAGAPDIWPPEQEWGYHGPFIRVIIEVALAIDLIGDGPLHAEAGLISIRLRAGCLGIGGVGVRSRRKVSDLGIRIIGR